MIRPAVRRLLRPFARPLRRVVGRLTGFDEIRVRLDRQEAVFRGLEEAIREVGLRQERLLTGMTESAERRSENRSAADIGRRMTELDALLSERLDAFGREQAESRAATAAAVKAAESAMVEALTGEVDRLDGYLLLHASELRGAISDVARRLDGNGLTVAGHGPALAKAG